VISDVFVSVTVEAAAVHALTTPGDLVAFRYGERYLSNREDPLPRVIFCVRKETFGPAENIGRNPRPTRTRIVECMIRVQSTELNPTEQLLSDVCLAIMRQTTGYSTLGSVDWTTDASAWSTDSTIADLTVTFKIPVADLAVATQIVVIENTTAIAALTSGDVTVATK